MPGNAAKPSKRAREQTATEEDDWVHPIGNDASVACSVFLLLARRHVPGDVHPTCDLAMRALHMVWASVDDAMSKEEARQSFLRLATPGALSLTNVNGKAIVASSEDSAFSDLSSIADDESIVPPADSPFCDLPSICHGPRANVIVRVDTEALTGVTVIGDAFLFGCSSLRAVNLRGLVNVAGIGDNFLRSCRELKAVDLAPLAHVTEIGQSFLSRCSSLTAIDLAPLSQLTELPYGFLRCCSSLQSLDCRPLRNVTTIEEFFLEDCTALQELDVSSFATVSTVGYTFLAGCPALHRLDLSAMTNVTKLYEDFLLDDHQLESLELPDVGALATADIAGF